MTSLALTTSSLKPQAPTPAGPPAVNWSRWIAADDAARLLGIHPGTLKRRCKAMSRGGDAMHRAGEEDAAPGGGGNARWWINRSYDLRLAPGAAGAAHRVPDLGAYGEGQVDMAMQRVACVKRLWRMRAGETRPQKMWLPGLIKELTGEHPGLKISRSTLFAWHGRYKDPADLVNLIDTRGGNTRGEPDPLCWDLFKRLYLTEHKRKAKWCWKQVKAKARADGLTWCGYRQLLRLVRSKLSPAERCKHRNPEKYRSKYSDYIDMDPDTWQAGVTWIGDHVVLDLWCQWGDKLIRPWFTSFMDWRSQKIVGWVLSDGPNSRTILIAFARAMRDPGNQGGPDTVYIDNGKDYAAESFIGKTKAQIRKARSFFSGEDYDQPAFRGLYGMLSINVIFGTPYNARAKGKLEVWHEHSLHQDFDKCWETYAGNKPENRPSDLAAKLNDGKLVPTFEQVHARLGPHIMGYNASCDHNKTGLDAPGGERLSPDDCMSLARLRVFADPGVLDRFMLTYSKPVRVRRHRVTVPVLGKGMVYKSDDPVFADLNGRADEFRVGYDQDDLGEATLFDERMRPVCRLYHATFGRATQAPGDSGAVSRTHLSEAISKQRRLNRAKKLQAQAGFEQVLSTAELALIESGKDPSANPQSPTPNAHPTKLVQTPVDGHANELQRQELKQAAGGEFTPPRDDDDDFTIPDTLKFMDGIELSGIELSGIELSGGELSGGELSGGDDDGPEDPWSVCDVDPADDDDADTDPLALLGFDDPDEHDDEPAYPADFFDDGGAA